MKKTIMLAAMITSAAMLLCSCSLRGGKLRAELPCDVRRGCLMNNGCDISFSDGNMYFFSGDRYTSGAISAVNTDDMRNVISNKDLSEHEVLNNMLVYDGDVYVLIINDMNGQYRIGIADEENRTVTTVIESGEGIVEWTVYSGKIVYATPVFKGDNMERRNVFVYDIESGDTENVCAEVCGLTGEGGKLWFVDEQDDGYVIGSYDIESGIIETAADFKLGSVIYFCGVSANYCVYTALVDGEDEPALYYYDVAKGTSTLICGPDPDVTSTKYVFCGDKFYYACPAGGLSDDKLAILDLSNGEETVSAKFGSIQSIAVREDGGAYVETAAGLIADIHIYSVEPNGTSQLIYRFINF